MDVKVKIKTAQLAEDGDLQVIESFYKGERIEKNGNVYVNFTEFDTLKDSKSTIKISEDEVLILKSGGVKSRMKFREAEKSKSIYITPFGEFDMSVYTYKISKKISDEEVKINLDYKISIKGLLDANNRIEIKVTSEE